METTNHYEKKICLVNTCLKVIKMSKMIKNDQKRSKIINFSLQFMSKFFVIDISELVGGSIEQDFYVRDLPSNICLLSD